MARKRQPERKQRGAQAKKEYSGIGSHRDSFAPKVNFSPVLCLEEIWLMKG